MSCYVSALSDPRSLGKRPPLLHTPEHVPDAVHRFEQRKIALLRRLGLSEKRRQYHLDETPYAEPIIRATESSPEELEASSEYQRLAQEVQVLDAKLKNDIEQTEDSLAQLNSLQAKPAIATSSIKEQVGTLDDFADGGANLKDLFTDIVNVLRQLKIPASLIQATQRAMDGLPKTPSPSTKVSLQRVVSLISKIEKEIESSDLPADYQDQYYALKSKSLPVLQETLHNLIDYEERTPPFQVGRTNILQFGPDTSGPGGRPAVNVGDSLNDDRREPPPPPIRDSVLRDMTGDDLEVRQEAIDGPLDVYDELDKMEEDLVDSFGQVAFPDVTDERWVMLMRRVDTLVALSKASLDEVRDQPNPVKERALNEVNIAFNNFYSRILDEGLPEPTLYNKMEDHLSPDRDNMTVSSLPSGLSEYQTPPESTYSEDPPLGSDQSAVDLKEFIPQQLPADKVRGYLSPRTPIPVQPPEPEVDIPDAKKLPRRSSRVANIGMQDAQTPTPTRKLSFSGSDLTDTKKTLKTPKKAKKSPAKLTPFEEKILERRMKLEEFPSDRSPLKMEEGWGDGVKAPHYATANKLKVQPDGTFGSLTIDMDKFKNMFLHAKKGRKIVAKGPIDADLYDLLTKRFSKSRNYSAKALDDYRNLCEKAGIPKTISPQSGKGKILEGRGMKYYKSNDELVERLHVVMGSIRNGNKSKELLTEASEILDKLKDSGSIKKPEYEKMLKSLMI